MKKLLLLVCLFSWLTLPYFADEWKRVYLTSYPRSGSHWMRYLIEEVTNIATSSVYQDKDLPRHMPTPFAWGGYCPNQGYEGNRQYPKPGEIVVIKTHFPAINEQPFDSLAYIKAIRIVRHPADSIYSYYIYQNRARISTLSKAMNGYIKSWRRYQEYWNKQPNVLTVRYEDLVCNPRATLSRIMQAIGYDFRNEDIERAIAKYPPKEGLMKHLNRFSKSDLNKVHRELADLLKQFDYSITTLQQSRQ